MDRYEEKGLRRFLVESEIALLKSHRSAAGFWAAKEACSKALGTGISAECGFHDILISKSPKGAPTISLRRSVIEKFDIRDISLSITHDGEYAIAVVAIESNSMRSTSLMIPD